MNSIKINRILMVRLLVGCIICMVALLVIWSKKTNLPPMSDFQKGIVYATWWHGEYSSPESDQTLVKAIKPTGANWISIVVTDRRAHV